MLHGPCHQGDAIKTPAREQRTPTGTATAWSPGDTECREDVEPQQLLPRLLGGRGAGGAATLEDRVVTSYKTKHTLTMRSSNHAPWYFPKGVERCVYTKTDIQMFIEALFIYS